MRHLLRDLRRDQRGVTMVEYALIAGFISIVIITSVSLLGTNVKGLFQNLVDKMP